MNSIEETELSDFRRQIETNLFGTIIVTKAAIPIMRQQRAGHIIQFSSVGGPHRSARSCAIFRRKMGRGRLLGSACERNGAHRRPSHSHRARRLSDRLRWIIDVASCRKARGTDAGDCLVDVPMERPQGAYLVKT